MKNISILLLILLLLNLNAFAWNNGTGAENDPYLISTPADLIELSQSSDSHEGEFFKMTSDIDMAGITDFRAIGTTGSVFKGNFNGQDFKIKNLVVTIGGYSNEYIALFGKVESGTIENIHITGNSYMQGNKYIASFVAYINEGTVDNCSSSASVIANGEYGEYAGGIVGDAVGSQITNCYNTGCISALGENTSYIGGVVGNLSGGGRISSCYNLGLVTGANYVGGVCGSVGNEDAINYSYNKGIVNGLNEHIGGVAGWVRSGLLTNGIMYVCYNTGKVTGIKYVGGVVGQTATTTNSCNIGIVEAVGDFVGGIAGAGIVNNSYNKASVSGNKAVGGIVGNLSDVNNCYNVGSVTGNENVGGIVGEVTGVTDNKILNSYNSGSVTIETTNQYVGGVVGYLNSGGLTNSNKIQNTYWNTDIYSGAGVGGRVNPDEGATGNFLYYGRTSAQLRNNFYTILGTEWVDDIQNINDGYPVLSGVVATLSPIENDNFVVTASAGENGTISAAGETGSVAGSSLLYFITPNDGWIVDKITVDGVDKGSYTVFNLENISGNHILHVTFKDPSSVGFLSTSADNISCYLLSEMLHVENASEFNMNIYDITGRKLFAKEIMSDNETVDISNLKNGAYVILLQKNNISSTFKIVK
ncbi:MAG: T9SS type A sorting domain-containing protein [Bacteroidales bacterium]|jgi:hypothetical protein|nr:T9SS type A sorting domain-containing protein [Bacteroidales bacterium]